MAINSPVATKAWPVTLLVSPQADISSPASRMENRGARTFSEHLLDGSGSGNRQASDEFA